MPFKSEFSITPGPLGLPIISPTGLQSQMLSGLVFLLQDPKAQTSQSFVRISAVIIVLPFMNCSPGVLDLTISVMTPPLLTVSLWFLLYIFSCRSLLVGSDLLNQWLFCKWL